MPTASAPASAPAKIIVFCTPKGGAGKTTLAFNVAATLPGKTLLLDADPQRSALKWADGAPEDAPLPMAVMAYTGDKIHREIRKVVQDYGFVLVDTPPSALATSTVTRSALLAADLAIVPVIPSPLDIWEAASIAELIAEINDIRGSGGVAPLAARLAVNRLKPRTTFGNDIREALEDIGIPTLKTAIHEREAYKHAVLDGTSVHGITGPGGRAAAAEIDKLTRELTRIVR